MEQSLLDYVYDGYANSPEVISFFSSLEMLFAEVNAELLRLKNNICIKTADKSGLTMWGHVYNCPPEIWYICAIKDTEVGATENRLRETAAKYTGCTAESVELQTFPSDGIVKLIIPDEIRLVSVRLAREIERIRPAHIRVQVVYKGIPMAHEKLSTYTHGELSVYTHERITEGNL